MSHFCGLVILTPEYAKANGLDDALAKFDEGLEHPEYCKGQVSNYDKVQFLEYYLVKKENAADKLDELAWMRKFVNFMRGKKGFITKKDFYEQYPRAQKDGYKPYFNHLAWENKDRYAEFFIRERQDIYKQFNKCYKKHGEDWNGGTWRKNALGVWCEYSTYNPDSKWDWYTVGGRWDNSIKTKDGEFVNMCTFGEIDFEPYPEDCYEDANVWLHKPYKKLKDGLKWHYSTKDMPFCLIIDGVWYEKGEMGWWGMTANEKESGEWQGEVAELLKNIPADAEVYNVDFHI